MRKATAVEVYKNALSTVIETIEVYVFACWPPRFLVTRLLM
jgi:hypothetical protein